MPIGWGGALDKTDSQQLLTLGDTFILQLTKGKEKGNFLDFLPPPIRVFFNGKCKYTHSTSGLISCAD